MGQISSSSVTERAHIPRTQFSSDMAYIPKDSMQDLKSETASSLDKSSTTHLPAYALSPARANNSMTTQTSPLTLHKNNSFRDLAVFLKTTGPTNADGIPLGVEKPKRAPSSRSAFRFFKKRAVTLPSPVTKAHEELNGVLHDVGNLLLPKNVEQKVSLTGKRYLAMKIPDKIPQHHDEQSIISQKRSLKFEATSPPTAECVIVDSPVSMVLAEDVPTLDGLDEWHLKYGDGRRSRSPVSPLSSHGSIAPQPATVEMKAAPIVKRISLSTEPIRPAASNPPSPPLESAITIVKTYEDELAEHPDQSTGDTWSTRRKAGSITRKPVTPMPTLVLPKEEFPVRAPRFDKTCDIKHPSPTRNHISHPVLQRTSDMINASQIISPVVESPETPPPKSPLRLRRDQRTIERAIELAPEPKTFIKAVSRVQTPEEPRHATVIPTVTTECTGPLSRTTSSSRAARHTLYPTSRLEREERIRARKARDRPLTMTRTIDNVGRHGIASPRQRLRKARPPTMIDDLKPAPLTTRITTEVSSGAGWRKHTQIVVTPARHSEDMQSDPSMPASPSNGTGSPSSPYDNARLDSVMLVAEEIPIPKTKSPFRPAKIVVAKERVYTPRPRSASMPKSAAQRRSRNSVIMPSRVLTPEMPKESETPPLPSPPPNRALPPTPPASGSERLLLKKKYCKIPAPNKTPPAQLMSSAFEWSSQPVLGRSRQYISSSAPDEHQRPAPVLDDVQLRNRLAELEHHNVLLEAALAAVLKANGCMNGPPASLISAGGPKYAVSSWEDRVTRRSEASHTASSSNGSALDMYMSTRRGSKTGLVGA